MAIYNTAKNGRILGYIGTGSYSPPSGEWTDYFAAIKSANENGMLGVTAEGDIYLVGGLIDAYASILNLSGVDRILVDGNTAAFTGTCIIGEAELRFVNGICTSAR